MEFSMADFFVKLYLEINIPKNNYCMIKKILVILHLINQ